MTTNPHLDEPGAVHVQPYIDENIQDAENQHDK